MSPEKMRTIARKENRCIIEVQSAKAKVISIARQKCNAKGVRKSFHNRFDLLQSRTVRGHRHGVSDLLTVA